MLPSVGGASVVVGDVLAAMELVGAGSGLVGAHTGLAGASGEQRTLEELCLESGVSAGSSWMGKD